MTRSIPSLRKAAILLQTLDAASADDVLRELDRTSAEMVTAELARLDGIDPDEQSQVIEELKQRWQQSGDGGGQSGDLRGDSGGTIADELPVTCVAAPAKAALGNRHGPPVGTTATDSPESRSESRERGATDRVLFGCLKSVPLQTLCSAIRQEQPRVIALVLSYLPAGRAAKVLENLPEALQHDVVRFMTTPQEVQLALAEQVEARLRLRIEAEATVGQRQADGVTLAARLLNRTARTTAGRILAGLERKDPELAARLNQRRWSFDNLADLDDALLAVTVRQMEPADLALALKGASARVCRRCLRLLPKPVSRRVKGHMRGLGPVRLSDIETAQAYLITLLEEVSSSAVGSRNLGR